MKKKIKSGLLNFPGFQALCRLLTRRHVRTLMYHRFSTTANGDPRFVDGTMLDSQVTYICRHHAVIEPSNHLEALQDQHLGNCPVAITVDDGYLDFHEIAFPIFTKHSFPAMLFVATGFVSGDTWFWWDKLAYVLDCATPKVHPVGVNKNITELDLSSPASRNSCWHMVADRCRFLANHEKESLIAKLAVSLGGDLPQQAPNRFAASDWNQIREMAQQGILIGAHTVNHPILTRVSDEVAETEIRDSQIQLEKELGHPIGWFCYPQGGPADFNAGIRSIVEKYYDGCFVAYQDMDNPKDPFTMPRYCVTDDMDEFRWVLCGAEYLGLVARKLIGLSTGTSDSYWAGSNDDEGNHE